MKKIIVLCLIAAIFSLSLFIPKVLATVAVNCTITYPTQDPYYVEKNNSVTYTGAWGGGDGEYTGSFNAKVKSINVPWTYNKSQDFLVEAKYYTKSATYTNILDILSGASEDTDQLVTVITE
ncbi:MAG TPA: hypothetical protein DD426_12680 [Clostridiaceae bacterium]|nr:hypothetical protein [Clostridiaceae bacterium]